MNGRSFWSRFRRSEASERLPHRFKRCPQPLALNLVNAQGSTTAIPTGKRLQRLFNVAFWLKKAEGLAHFDKRLSSRFAAPGKCRGVLVATSTGTVESANEPLPSWPFEFKPQHFALPFAANAHECAPVAMATMPEASPTTSVGDNAVTFVPLPTCPVLL